MHIKTFFVKNKLLAFLISLALGLLISYQINFSTYSITIDFLSPKTENLQVFTSNYFSYSERNSHTISTKKNIIFTPYKFDLKQRNILNLRIDPQGDFQIKSIIIQNRNNKFVYEGPELFSMINVKNQVTNLHIDNGIIHGTVTGIDPQIELSNIPILNPTISVLGTILLIFFTAICFILLSYSQTLISQVSNLYSNTSNKESKLLWLNVLITIIIFAFPPESFLYLKFIAIFPFVFVLPGYLVLLLISKNKREFNYLTLFLLTVGLSVSLFVTIMFLLEENKIRTNVYSIYFITIIALLFLNLKNLRHKKIIVSNDSISWKYFFIFNIMLVVFIIPTKGLWVAPLHDPVANSFMALYLINHSYSETPPLLLFYPPGMSYFIALFADISKISTSKSVLIITNLFNLFAGFSFAIFFSELFSKKKMLPVFLFSFSFLSLFVTSLYFTAGKNSQILGYFMVFCSLYLFKFSQKKDFGLIFLSFLIMTSSVLIHYNNIILIVFFVPLIFFESNWRDQSIKSIAKNATLQITAVLPFLFVLILLLLRIMNFNSQQDSLLNPVSNINFAWHFPSIDEFWLFIKSSCSGNLTLVFSVLGVITSAVVFIIERKSRYMIMVAFLLSLYFFIISIGKIGLFSKYNHMNLYIIGVIFSSIFIYSLVKLVKLPMVKSIIYILLLIFSTIRLNEIYNEYQDARKYSLVTNADLLAFDWIKQNTHEDDFFLPASIKRRPYPLQSFEMDASSYLKVFANRETAVTFISGEKFALDDYEIRSEYDKLINDPTNQESINFFCSRNIKYIYDGAYKPWGNPDVDPDIFSQNPSVFQVVYDTLDVKIYKIISPNN